MSRLIQTATSSSAIRPTEVLENDGENVENRGGEQEGGAEEMDAKDVVENGAENIDDEGEGDEARTVRKMADPKLPTAKEVSEHCPTHLPYRSWCEHCMKGRGLQMAHKGKQRGQPGRTRDPHGFLLPWWRERRRGVDDFGGKRESVQDGDGKRGAD